MWYAFQTLPIGTERPKTIISSSLRRQIHQSEIPLIARTFDSMGQEAIYLSWRLLQRSPSFLIFSFHALQEIASPISTIKKYALLSRRLTCHLSKLSSIYAHIDQHITYEQNTTINRSQILVNNTKVHYITQCKERFKIPKSIITQSNQRTAIPPPKKNNGLLKGRVFFFSDTAYILNTFTLCQCLLF